MKVVQVLVRDLSDGVVERLTAKAAAGGRSLEVGRREDPDHRPHVIFGDRQDPSADLTSADPDYAGFKIRPARFYVVKGYVEKEWRDERVEVPVAL